METFNNKLGGDAKIEEYINRIKRGESKEEIMKDLPDFFKLKIEEGLQKEENIEVEDKTPNNELIEKKSKGDEEDKNKIEELRRQIGIENIELKKGTRVLYEGREWKIADVINHKYETEDGEKVIPVYNLERDDGYILENGGVTKYIFRDDFEIDE